MNSSAAAYFIWLGLSALGQLLNCRHTHTLEQLHLGRLFWFLADRHLESFIKSVVFPTEHYILERLCDTKSQNVFEKNWRINVILQPPRQIGIIRIEIFRSSFCFSTWGYSGIGIIHWSIHRLNHRISIRLSMGLSIGLTPTISLRCYCENIAKSFSFENDRISTTLLSFDNVRILDDQSYLWSKNFQWKLMLQTTIWRIAEKIGLLKSCQLAKKIY